MQSQEVKTQKCTKCGKQKPLDKFRTMRNKHARERTCMACRSAVEKKKEKRGVTARWVPCYNNCGNNVLVEVEDGTRPPRMICERCTATGAPWHRGTGGHAEQPISMFCDPVPDGEVQIYRPGDPMFHYLSTVVTPVNQCRLVGTLGRPGERSVW